MGFATNAHNNAKNALAFPISTKSLGNEYPAAGGIGSGALGNVSVCEADGC